MLTLPPGAEKNPRLAAMAAQSRRLPQTQIGVGVVSLNVVDAAIELAQDHDVSIMLIGSRRQVDTEELGGGYVDGLTPFSLCERVRARDKRDRVLVCRDHGGPWMGNAGTAGSPEHAMEEARVSFVADIEAGYDILHIDTSVDPGGVDDTVPLQRLLELYSVCWEAASDRGATIAFEVGDEEQANVAEGLDKPRRLLEQLEAARAELDGAPTPLFVVAQTGTKVMERRNVGSLSAPYRIDGHVPPRIYMPQLMSLLEEHGTHLRQHNTDYLDDEVLSWLPRLGIHAANIAPEYGVEETLGLLALMEGRGATDLAERFLTLAFETRKWEKWELEGSGANDRDRAIWAGHYVFSTEEFARIRGDLEQRLGLSAADVDARLKARVRASIERYLRAFRLI